MFSVISDTKTKVSLCQRLQPPTKILRLSFLCQRIKPPKNEKDSCRRFELPKQKIGKHFSKDSSKDKVFPWKEIEAFLLNCHCRPGGSLVAVCSSSIQWKSTRKYEQLRDWLSEHTHSIDECGAKFEMTGVHTVVLVMDKAA